jgi:tetratricopeptide (TPR) repeat protein
LLLSLAACASREPQLPVFAHPIPTVSRRAVLDSVRSHDWNALEALFEGLEAKAREHADGEVDLAQAFAAFDTAEAEIGEALRQWVGDSPSSTTAVLALGNFYLSEAWARRGTDWASETTEEQWRGLELGLDRVGPLAHEALARQPGRIEGWLILMTVAQISDRGDCEDLAAKALEVHPESFRIRSRLQTCLSPRWGGSYEAMRRAASEARSQFERNPRLASLHGFADSDRSQLARKAKRFDEALELADRALKTGENARFHYQRALALSMLRRNAEAIAVLDRALAISPESPQYLVTRGLLRLREYQDEEARQDYELARELEPQIEGLSRLEEALRARPARAPSTVRSDALVTQARRAWDQRDLDAAAGDLREAIRIDPSNFKAYQHLDRILTWRRQWGEAGSAWDAYLTARPDDPKALLERSRVLFHVGRADEARADLERACGLGEGQACERLAIVERGSASPPRP